MPSDNIPPTSITLDPDRVSQLFLDRIPIQFARRFQIIGMQNGNAVLQLAMCEPFDDWLLDTVSTTLNCPVEPIAASNEAVLTAIHQAYSHRSPGAASVLDQLAIERTEQVVGLSDQGDLLEDPASAPVISLINRLLLEAVNRRASDLHIQPAEEHVLVRLRIDGVLYDFLKPPRSLLDEMVSRIKVIGRMDIAEKRLPQDGRTTVSVGDRIVDLRISSLPTSHGERVVIRLLDKSARLYRLEELGMSKKIRQRFQQLICQTHGIILVTGPTGSGKSTTLYAALQELDCSELNILTLEDPIEYQLPGISQTQISSKKGMTFATGLRTVLRQDPDVIMVGEIRDEETARMAVQSALTGHLVFSTLHTNDAAGTVTRLLDLGIEPYLVASSLLAVLAQRLVRNICPHCKIALTERPADEMIPVEAELFHGTGCDQCLDTGYFGRLGIFELLLVDETVRPLILQRSQASMIKQAGMAAGMHTLRNDAMDRLQQGMTTFEEVLRVTHRDHPEQSYGEST